MDLESADAPAAVHATGRVILAIAAGGAAGAVARYLTAGLVQRAFSGTKEAGLPLGTLAVNLVGCLLIGVLWARLDDGSLWRVGLVVGFLGAFTTFSSYGMELFELLRAGAVARACAYLALSNVLGLLLVALGFRLGSR